MQGRMSELVGAPSGFTPSYPPEVKRRLNALKNLQVRARRPHARNRRVASGAAN